MSASSDSPSPAEAEADAEQARAGLVDTLNQLRENLKPGNVADEVMTNAKASASVVTEQIWDVARKNPVPALLIGAGLAMILGVGQRVYVGSTRRETGPGASGGAARAAGNRQAMPLGSERAMHIAMSSDESTSTSVSTTNRIASAASRGSSAFKSTFRSGTSRAAELGNSMSSYSASRDQLTNSLSKMIEDQPLILAAVGIAVGAALGAAVPQTQTENSLMGSSSHSVKDAANEMVQGQIAQLKSAASHAVDDIKQTVADHGVNADNLSGLVHDVAEKTRTATAEAGRNLGQSSSNS